MRYTNEQRAEMLAHTANEQGNNIDPMMGTCLGVFNTQEVRDCKTMHRVLQAEQDGADFYRVGKLVARYEYPFTSRNDWYSLEAAQEAAAMFLRDNPTFRL